MAVSRKIGRMMESSSWIRRMFETGNQLRAIHGVDKVCDFSLGNPDVEPPAEFQRVLQEIVSAVIPHKHGYMPNAGYTEVRAKVARQVSKEQGVDLAADNVIMACGAGGGLNSALKAILNPGDEVLVSTPCFVEYGFYADNHGGSLVLVPGKPDFDLDVEAIRGRITEKTAAIIVNSPNNPSGRIYPASTLEKLAAVLLESAKKTGRPVYLVSDEPYRALSYDGVEVPGIMALYPHSLVVSSYSKALSLPGERIGYVAVSPEAADAKALVDAVVFCTRILGYVNAPALMQRTVSRLQGLTVDANIYKKKRDILCAGLKDLGYEFQMPQGAFYLFPKAPGGDDLAFVQELQKELVLVVPGRGFELSGYFRVAFCVDTGVITRSFEGFSKAIKALR